MPVSVPAQTRSPSAGWALEIALVVLDAVPLVGDGLAYLADRHRDLRVTGVVGSVAAARAALAAQPAPAVVAVGDTVPGAGEFIAELRALHPGVGVVVVSHHSGTPRPGWARAAGASAFVGHDAPVATLVAAIRHARQHPRRFRAFAGGPAPDLLAVRPAAPELSALSEREQQVLSLVGEGRSHARIAEALGIREGTVRTYVTRIYTKLNVRNRAQALMAAFNSPPW